MMIILVLASCSLQEIEIIRQHREGYQSALVEYNAALILINNEPRKALQTIDKIFDNARIDKKDRKIVFEPLPGRVSRAVDFYPYQARGKIRLALAKAEPENAAGHLASAITDLKVSVDAGVKSSEDLLERAKAAQARLKAAKPPEPAKESAAEKSTRESWQKLIDDKKWKAAREAVEAKGSGLSAEAKKSLLAATEDRCRKAVATTLEEFLKALEFNSRPALVRGLKRPEFVHLFALPPEADLVTGAPELDWARKELDLLERLRQMEPGYRAETSMPILDGLVAQMLQAEAFEKAGEDWWFKSSGQLTVHFLEDMVHALALRAKEAGPDEGPKLRQTAEQACAKWSEAMSKVPRDFLARNPIHDNPKRLAAFLDEFPLDSGEVDRIDVEACFTGSSPDLALEKVISDLTRIRNLQESRLQKDALRKLLTELVAATAAHELLAGKSVEDVQKGLQEIGRSLSKAGGAVDPAHWGPKIERVFSALK
jgi:hypothetical protein